MQLTNGDFSMPGIFMALFIPDIVTIRKHIDTTLQV